MISTGSPAASLPATCGSDPIDLGAPFGGRHGTRLKMSLADFATCLTFSIALSVRLFGCGGLIWSTAATLPCSDFSAVGLTLSDFAPSDFAVSDLAVSDLAVSDLAASDLAASDLALSDKAACWAACARAGAIAAGVSSNSAATAGAASNVIV